MKRMNNLVTLFTAMVAFFFGSFLTNVLHTAEKCPAPKSGVIKLEPHPDIFLVVLVVSAAQNVNRRQTIRDTWLRLAQPLEQPYYPEDFLYLPKYDTNGHLQLETVTEQSNRLRIYLDWLDGTLHAAEATRRLIQVKHFFAIGTANIAPGLRAELEREQKSYGDMLLLPRLEDSYANLTEKILHAIDALTNHYEFSYLLKADDDTFVKLDNLLNELVSYDRKLVRKTADYHGHPLPALYWGYFDGRASVKTKGKWRETNYYLSSRYVTYALGGGYVVSRKICDYIAANSRLLSTYISEDISMGTWLAPLKFVYRRHDPRFDTQYMSRKCRRYHLVLHKVSEEDMQRLYNGKICVGGEPRAENTKSLVPYFYDWKKPADRCCETPVI